MKLLRLAINVTMNVWLDALFGKAEPFEFTGSTTLGGHHG